MLLGEQMGGMKCLLCTVVSSINWMSWSGMWLSLMRKPCKNMGSLSATWHDRVLKNRPQGVVKTVLGRSCSWDDCLKASQCPC
jgi:hypothetical protein